MKVSTQTLLLDMTFGIEEAVRIICESGYDCIDYSFLWEDGEGFTIESDGFLDKMVEVRKLAETYGVSFNQAHAPFASFREGDDEYNVWIKPLIIKSIEAGGILGIRNLIVHPFTMSVFQKQANMEFFESLLPYAQKHDIRIAIENMFRFSWKTMSFHKNVCSDAAELIDYVDSMNSEYIVACLDIGHCKLVGEDAADMIRKLGKDRLRCLHIQDNDGSSDAHTLPFMGSLDFTGIINALKEIGYMGELTLEADNFLKDTPKELMRDACVYMQKTVRHLADMFEKA